MGAAVMGDKAWVTEGFFNIICFPNRNSFGSSAIVKVSGQNSFRTLYGSLGLRVFLGEALLVNQRFLLGI